MKKSAWKELEHWSTLELDSAEAAGRASMLVLDFEAHPEKYTDPENLSSPFSRIVGIFQLTLAQAHPDVAVRMEAAWAAARGGDALAVARLQSGRRSRRPGSGP